MRKILSFSNNKGWPTKLPRKTLLKRTIDHNDDEIELYAINHLLGWAASLVVNELVPTGK